MQSYESIVRRAADACAAPMATLAIVEHDRARFKASFGAECAEELPLTFSLLAETLAADDVFLVEDARADERFANSPVVTSGPRVCAYAGVALHAPDGSVVGILSVADWRAGPFTQEQLCALRDFGVIASALIFSTRELAMSRLMSRAVEEALDFVLLTDAAPPSEGGPFIEYANASLLYALGYTSDELIGQPCPIVFASTNDPVTLQSIEQNLERAKDNEKELQLLRKDGSAFWVEFTGRPLLDPAGTPTHWVSVGRDITANRETLAQTAALVKALDSVTDHVEIYMRENGEYALVFQNGAADADASGAAETLLSDASVVQSLQNGEVIRRDELSMRPLRNGESVICVRRHPEPLAAVS